MLKLRTILLSNKLYYLILLITVLIVGIRLLVPNKSHYDINTKNITGTIIDIKQNKEQVKLMVKANEKILAIYYLKEKEQFSYKLGDKVELFGTLTIPSKNTTEYIFNYQKYLEHKNIFYILEVDRIKIISKNRNIYYYLKQKVISSLKNDAYLYTFIIGEKYKLSKLVLESYQKNGLSHLFAISGMHISLLSSIMLKILKKIKVEETKRYFITSIFLLLYLLITGISPSILRGVLFFILFSINKVYYFYIKPINIFILTLIVSLLIDENYLYDIAFWYSYSISFALIIMSPYLKSKNYFLSLLKTSFISFLVSLPISLYNFYEVNFLSIIYNLFFVPFVSLIVFPLSLLTFICPMILPIFKFITVILEKISLFLGNITIFTFSFPRLNILVYVSYIVFVIIFLWGLVINKKKNIYPLLLLLISHYLYPYFIRETYLKMIDVGQGDSLLLHSNNQSILIDTGGVMSYQEETNYSVVKSITIPLLKSLGIRKLDYLILTHGDMDHMGEARKLLENFKVKYIVLNLGENNYLEKEIIKDYPVIVGKEGYQITCGDIQLIQLNEMFLDENSSSQIYYGQYRDISMLFMGDASKESEKNLLKKYEIPDIDILKVGHHGSITSSSNDFIKKINPKISLISVGLNNKFNHPTPKVIDTLLESDSLVYQTSIHGTTTIDLKRLQIEVTN